MFFFSIYNSTIEMFTIYKTVNLYSHLIQIKKTN